MCKCFRFKLPDSLDVDNDTIVKILKRNKYIWNINTWMYLQDIIVKGISFKENNRIHLVAVEKYSKDIEREDRVVEYIIYYNIEKDEILFVSWPVSYKPRELKILE